MRGLLSWLVGIATLVASYGLLSLAGNQIGVTTFVDFGEFVTVTRGSGRYAYDEDISGSTTAFGWSVLLISLTWSIMLGRVIARGHLPDRDSDEARFFFGATTFAVVYGFFGVLMWLTFGNDTDLPGLVFGLMDLLGAIIAFIVGRAAYRAVGD